jgi:hypothetical protein
MVNPYLSTDEVKELPEVAVIGKIITDSGYTQDPHLPRIFRKEAPLESIEAIIYGTFVQCIIIDISDDELKLRKITLKVRLEFSDPSFVEKLTKVLIPDRTLYQPYISQWS